MVVRTGRSVLDLTLMRLELVARVVYTMARSRLMCKDHLVRFSLLGKAMDRWGPPEWKPLSRVLPDIGQNITNMLP